MAALKVVERVASKVVKKVDEKAASLVKTLVVSSGYLKEIHLVTYSVAMTEYERVVLSAAQKDDEWAVL